MSGGGAPPAAHRFWSPDGRPARSLYQVVRGIVMVVGRLYWRLTVVGREHVPTSGAFVIAPVHRSNVDTLVVSALTRRRIRYMGKDSLWKARWAAWFLSALGGFPVARGTADREALRAGLGVLDGGEPLVVFPEGTRQSGPEVQPLYEGAAYLAARTGVPILPVGIGGSEAVMRKGSKAVHPGRITLVVGEPIPAPESPGGRRPSRRAVAATTATLHTTLQQLFDVARGVA